MAITPLYFNYELTDGSVIGPIRIQAADKIAAEQTARRAAWEYTDSPRIHALMGFHAAARAGLYDREKGFEAFISEIVDYDITKADETPTTATSGTS